MGETSVATVQLFADDQSKVRHQFPEPLPKAILDSNTDRLTLRGGFRTQFLPDRFAPLMATLLLTVLLLSSG